MTSTGSQTDGETKPLKVSPPILRLGPVGRWIRSQLMAGILHGTPVLVRVQSLRTPVADSFMQASSFLGEEEFYLLLVTFIVWVVDARLGRHMVFLMALCFYLTGFLKNLLCLPRPPSPPVNPLQRCQDWGLPSHHAVLNVTIPWFLWFYVTFNYSTPISVLALLFSGLSLWSFCVLFSRIYLGVHSPADILTGGIVGCLLLAFWLQSYEAVDDFLSASPAGSTIFFLLCAAVVLLLLHPDPPPVTIIYAETVCMVGVAVGFVVGHLLPFYSSKGLLELRDSYGSIFTVVLCSSVRYILGLVVLLVLKQLAAWVVAMVLTAAATLVGMPTVCVKRRSEVTAERVHFSDAFIVQDVTQEVESSDKQLTWTVDRPLNLYIPVTFLAYISMGVVAVEICPALFLWAGI